MTHSDEMQGKPGLAGQTRESKGIARAWRTLTAVPHRGLFLAGMVGLLSSMVAWVSVLSAGVATGGPPGLIWHGHVLIFGVFPSFVFGFLLTVFPRWQPSQPIPRPVFTTVAALMFTGLVLSGPLGLFSMTAFLAGGLALFAGWLIAVTALVRCWAMARARVSHSNFQLIVLFLGIIAQALALGSIAGGQYAVTLNAVQAGFWMFLFCTYFNVTHRMVPFFTSRVIADYRLVRPAWSVPAVIVLAMLHVAFRSNGFGAGMLVVDAALFALLLGHLIAWQPWKTWRMPIAWTLHVAYAWAAVALGLYTLDAGALTGIDLGKAPLHAVGAGFFGSMLVAMVTRVTLGHSGRALVMDRFTVACFLFIQIGAVARVLADVGVITGGMRGDWLAVSGAIWVAAFLAWAGRYGWMLATPRVDGQAG